MNDYCGTHLMVIIFNMHRVYFSECNDNIFGLFQLIPYFLMDVFGSYPGIPGLFVAAIFSAALRYNLYDFT